MGEAKNGLLKFITCGSVDDGKSTLIGHILYDSKLLYADQEQALVLDSRVGSRGGAIDYSLLLDGLMAEREQGITIDVAYRYFTTEVRSFIVADTPGHEEYTRNMAVGASFADLAVILVDASMGVLVQTRRHARICALMGIPYFVFAVNKMDLVGYRREVFEKIAADIAGLRRELALESVAVIPLCATEGDNVTVKSANLPWYEGPALLPYLETVDIAAGRADSTKRGFYMPVQRVCRPDHTFRGFQGQIEAGEVAVGEEITVLPSRETAFVRSIYVGDRQAQRACAGQPVTVSLDREVDVSRGCVLLRGTDLAVAKAFSASFLWMDDEPLAPGREYWVKIGTKLLPGVVNEIRYKVDVNSGERLTAETLRKNEIALCAVTLAQPAVLDVFGANKTLGELILIDRVSCATAACGVVEKIRSGYDGPVFQEGAVTLPVGLFDTFYYHADTNSILRNRPKNAVYHVGDELPLRGDGYRYPPDFDVLADGRVARIRKGTFAGFARSGGHGGNTGSANEGRGGSAGSADGKRGETVVPLLNAQGFGLCADRLLPFETYRAVAIWEDRRNEDWENSYEI
ncbi:MAG: sulfate adenylyltransferase [Clostridium sp.]|jgi:sulfate adenylyltransferase subunit 1|nr:sulfate adenylyltransferase [Clostridium sp.]